MTNKIAIGIVVILIIVGLFFLLRSSSTAVPATAPTQNASSTAIVSSAPQAVGVHSQSSSGSGTPALTVAQTVALFSSSSFTSTSTYPTITGVANTAVVGVIINNSKGVGIVGTSQIPVVNGYWSYTGSVALPPGSYMLVLFVGKTITQTAKLTVNKI